MASQTTLSITGMHCASCAAIITRKLKKTPGVTEAGVNYGSNKATVAYDENVVGVPGLIEAIIKAGYGAVLASSVNREDEKRRKEKEITDARRKFFWGLLLSLPLLYFMAGAVLPLLPLFGGLPPPVGVGSLPLPP